MIKKVSNHWLPGNGFSYCFSFLLPAHMASEGGVAADPRPDFYVEISKSGDTWLFSRDGTLFAQEVAGRIELHFVHCMK